MKDRILYFDVLRAIAIICVLFIHTINCYSFDNESFNFKNSIYFRQLVNFGVPLFLFISGYFMAHKKFSTKEDYILFLKKQLPRVLIPFLIYSALYSAFQLVNGLSIKSVIINFILFMR
jgi:surface polysaccharide O-acyltransferase-like enzyme